MDLALQRRIEQAKRDHAQRDAAHPLVKIGGGQLLESIVYGANDGIITTFAVVAGVAGADLSRSIVLILGFANLIADGISMGMSNYLGRSSRLEYEESCRQQEEWEVDHIPEDERKEIEDIYRAKGFNGELLSQAVDQIISDRKRWIDEMMMWEFGVHPTDTTAPWKSGMTTFVAFVIAGLLPLLPYLFPISSEIYFSVSIAATAAALFIVGAARSWVTSVQWWISGLEMLGVGALAASAAYLVGALLTLVV